MVTQEKIIRELKTKWLHIYLRDDFVVITKEMEDFPNETGVNVAESIIDAINEVCNGEVYPMLSFIGDRKIGLEERKYYSNYNNQQISHCAMMVSNPFQRMLASFFLGLNKVAVPTKVFTSEEEALEWISLFKEKNSAS